MKEAHQEAVKVLTKAINNKSHENVQLGDIYKFRDRLFALKHSGDQFRQIMDASKRAKANEFKLMKEQQLDFSKAAKKGQKLFGSESGQGGKPAASGSGGKQPQQQKPQPKEARGPPKSSYNTSRRAAPQQQPESSKPEPSNFKCNICDGSHKSVDCQSHSLVLRKSIIKLKDLCTVCLEFGHGANKCPSEYKCKQCNERHSVVICPNGN